MRAWRQWLALHAYFQDGWRVLRLVVAIVPLGFGLALLVPGSTLIVGDTPLANVLSVTGWAIMSMVCGLAGLLSMITANRKTCIYSAAVTSTWHGSISIFAWASSGLSTGSVTYAALALGAYSLAWHSATRP